MITLYGSINSSAGRCIWALSESGVDFSLKPIDVRAKEQKQEWFLALNPNGKIPVLQDGEFTIWESYAINWYVAEKYAPSLLGHSLEDRAKIQQWTFWSSFHVQKHFEVVMYFSLFGHGNVESADKAKEDVKPFLKILDDYLSGKPFLLGGEFTLADINVGSVINLGHSMGVEYADYVHIGRWLASLKERPAYQTAVKKESTH